MKKNRLSISALAICAILITNASTAQQIKGTNYVNVGIGIGTFGFTGQGGVPLVGTFEHGFTNKISAGVSLGFIKRKFAEDYKYSYTVFGARGSYHFNEELNLDNPKLDVYGGAAIYYRSFKVKYKDEDPEYNFKSSGGDLGVGIFAGGRYLFTKRAGAFAEIGYGISPLQLGVSFKF